MKAKETLEIAAKLVSGDRAKKHGDMFLFHDSSLRRVSICTRFSLLGQLNHISFISALRLEDLATLTWGMAGNITGMFLLGEFD
jgi:hypothetical protein